MQFFSLRDRRVSLTGNVGPGNRTLRIVTDDPHWQDFHYFAAPAGRTVADAINWYDNRATVAPAADALGGVSSLQSNQPSFITAHFTPGAYLCFSQPEAPTLIPDSRGTCSRSPRGVSRETP